MGKKPPVTTWTSGFELTRLIFNGRATVGFGEGAGSHLTITPPVYDSSTNTTTADVTLAPDNGNWTNSPALIVLNLTNADRDGNFGADGVADKDGITNMRFITPGYRRCARFVRYDEATRGASTSATWILTATDRDIGLTVSDLRTGDTSRLHHALHLRESGRRDRHRVLLPVFLVEQLQR